MVWYSLPACMCTATMSAPASRAAFASAMAFGASNRSTDQSLPGGGTLPLRPWVWETIATFTPWSVVWMNGRSASSWVR